MERFVERLVASKSATKIGLGTGILGVLYLVYALCMGGFSFAALVSAVVSFIIGSIIWLIILFAVLMIMDGLLSIGE